MSKELVKLPREVTESIDRVRSYYKLGCEFDLVFLKKEDWKWIHPIIEFADESRENMMRYFQALVKGYEVEETPEDKVREYYLSYEREQHWTACNHIKSVLELLGITIEGVNA